VQDVIGAAGRRRRGERARQGGEGGRAQDVEAQPLAVPDEGMHERADDRLTGNGARPAADLDVEDAQRAGGGRRHGGAAARLDRQAHEALRLGGEPAELGVAQQLPGDRAGGRMLAEHLDAQSVQVARRLLEVPPRPAVAQQQLQHRLAARPQLGRDARRRRPGRRVGVERQLFQIGAQPPPLPAAEGEQERHRRGEPRHPPSGVVVHRDQMAAFARTAEADPQNVHAGGPPGPWR